MVCRPVPRRGCSRARAGTPRGRPRPGRSPGRPSAGTRSAAAAPWPGWQVVGRHAAQVAADERHRQARARAAVEVQEVADDHPERVQCQSSAAATTGWCRSPHCPRRWICAARRSTVAGCRWPVPGRGRSSSGSGWRSGRPGSSGTPCTTPDREPLRIGQVDGELPRCRTTRVSVALGQPVQVSPGVGGERRPDELRRAPRRTTRLGVPAQCPRSTSASGVRSVTVKPKSARNRLRARARSGFSNPGRPGRRS